MSSDCGYLKVSCPQMSNYLLLKLTGAFSPSLALSHVVQDILNGVTVREGAWLPVYTLLLLLPLTLVYVQ